MQLGAIAILTEIGTDCLHFGSESGSIKDFQQLLLFMQEHNEQWNALVKGHMQQGYSYPKASALAFKSLHTQTELSLEQPNNILGYHYVKAIADQRSSIKPYTTKRITAGYHDRTITSPTIASATSIREAIMGQDDASHQIQQVMPEASFRELSTYSLKHKRFTSGNCISRFYNTAF
ncbi:nucleotidyltransferase family protein [Alkalicoccobacillus plakortidis]|uniref:nucleotidyltransferase family protein n=1 Tax=Alkalicoccobacillus plakortidis TaxID=444060 RepID=UPI0027D96D05|nr:nucleotidyltransferase family protein [Alkalicoccobacillus plakortidis]